MSIIRLPIHFEGSKGEKTLYTLFDSGASFSCIHPSQVRGLCQVEKIRHPKYMATTAGDDLVKIDKRVRLDFYIDDILLSDEFMLVPELTEEAILGAATFQKWRIKLDFELDRVIVVPKIAKFILKDLKIRPA